MGHRKPRKSAAQALDVCHGDILASRAPSPLSPRRGDAGRMPTPYHTASKRPASSSPRGVTSKNHPRLPAFHTAPQRTSVSKPPSNPDSVETPSLITTSRPSCSHPRFIQNWSSQSGSGRARAGSKVAAAAWTRGSDGHDVQHPGSAIGTGRVASKGQGYHPPSSPSQAAGLQAKDLGRLCRRQTPGPPCFLAFGERSGATQATAPQSWRVASLEFRANRGDVPPRTPSPSRGRVGQTAQTNRYSVSYTHIHQHYATAKSAKRTHQTEPRAAPPFPTVDTPKRPWLILAHQRVKCPPIPLSAGSQSTRDE